MAAQAGSKRALAARWGVREDGAGVERCTRWRERVAEVARRKLAELLPASRVRSVTFSKDPHLGSYILVEVEASASEALELWEKLVEELHPQLKTPIFVVWSGGVDVSPAELGRRLGKLLAEMRVSPLTLSHPVDAVEELKREW